MAAQGIAALSLRAIASQMGMAAPSLYNYFKSRDDLLTALIIDGYNSLADAIELASKSCAETDYGGRMFAMLLAYRDWVKANPTDFIIISGTPVPGFQPTDPATTQAAIRIMSQTLQVSHAAWQAGQLRIPPEYTNLPPEHLQQLERWGQNMGGHFSLPVLHLALKSWGLTLGLMSLEIYGHTAEIISDAASFYRVEIKAFLQNIGLHVPD